jgi:hypothetical protein
LYSSCAYLIFNILLFDTSNLLKINDIHNFLYVKCLKFNSANGLFLLYIYYTRIYYTRVPVYTRLTKLTIDKVDNSELTLSKTLRRVFHKGLLDSFVKTRVTPSQRHQRLWKTPVILSGIGYM